MSRHKSKAKQVGSRNTRLAEQIQKDLAGLIRRELSVSAVGLVTLSHVELSADYAHAKVYFTVIGQAPEVSEQALNEKAGYLHSLLFKMLHIHTVPTLRFFHDDHLLRGIEMSRLIDKAMGVESSADDGELDAFDNTEIKG